MRAEIEIIECEPKLLYLRREGKDQLPKLCVVEEEGSPLKMYRLSESRIKNLLAELAEFNRSLP